jgi:hypothetical protein
MPRPKPIKIGIDPRDDGEVFVTFNLPGEQYTARCAECGLRASIVWWRHEFQQARAEAA